MSRWLRSRWRGSPAPGSVPEPPGRRHARELAFRVIFQADVAGGTLIEAWELRREEERPGHDACALVGDVIATLDKRRDEVDEILRGAAENWTLDRLAATDRAVLRA